MPLNLFFNQALVFLAALFLLLLVTPFLALAAFTAGVIRSVRLKRLQTGRLLVPLAVLLLYLAAAGLLTDWDYVFHHDKGSRVYNETYLLPHYETVFHDKFTCVGKQAQSDTSVTYTFRSGKTGMDFKVASFYDNFNNAFYDARQSHAYYDRVLLTRLENGESLTCQTGEDYSLPAAEGVFFFRLDADKDGHRLSLRYSGKEGDDRSAKEPLAGHTFTVRLEDDTLLLSVPVKSGEIIEYRTVLTDISLSRTAHISACPTV